MPGKAAGAGPTTCWPQEDRVWRRQDKEIVRRGVQSTSCVSGGITNGWSSRRSPVVEAVDDSFAEVVEVKPISSSDRTLTGVSEQGMQETASCMGRVGKREARSEILVVPGPVGLLSIGLPGKLHRQVGRKVFPSCISASAS